MVTLYITRHGETEWNTQKRMQGHLDSPLTEKGIEQAKKLGTRLKDVKFDRVFSSPSPRAFKTAQLILEKHTIEPIVDERLREMNLGVWEGMTFEEVEKAYPEQAFNFWQKPHLYNKQDGEVFLDTLKKVKNFIEEIIDTYDGETILLVTHTITLKHIMSIWEGKSIEDFWKEPFIHQTSLSVVEADKESGKILLHGDIQHLESN